MSKVFISHVEEDAAVALQVALGLTEAGYGTWCYEVDSVPGPSYLLQTGRAIDDADAVLLVISPHSLASRQVTLELVRGHESGKEFLPLLHGISHVEFQNRQPEWREALGAATSIRVPPGGVSAVLPRIVEGLCALRVKPQGAPSMDRAETIRRALRETHVGAQARGRIEETFRLPSTSKARRLSGSDVGMPAADTEAESAARTDRRERAATADAPVSRPRSNERAFEEVERRPPDTIVASPSVRVGGARHTPPKAVALLLVVLGITSAGVLYATHRRGQAARAVTAPSTPAQTASKGEAPIIIGVMEMRARGPVPDWMRDFTRDGLNTVLSRVSGLQVYSKQKIDFVRERRGLSEIEAAETLGITKMVSGTISLGGSTIDITIQVVDIRTGLLEQSEELTGSEDTLVEMQNQAAVKMVRALRVPLSDADADVLLASRTNDTLKGYRLLVESLRGAQPGQQRSTGPPQQDGHAWRLPGLVTVAYAGDTPEEVAVRGLLEQYRLALEAKDMQRLAAVQAMTEAQRTAMQHYFENAKSLKVQFSDLDILVEGDGALATFLRRDDFTDAESGQNTHLELRVSSELAKEATGWRIRKLGSSS